MLTIGIDVAAMPKYTGAASIEWGTGVARIVGVETGVTDEMFNKLLDRGAAKIGLDVPLGWPSAFVESLALHHSGGAWAQSDRSVLTARATDRDVRGRTGCIPLSVSADKLAHPAMRAAYLLGRRGVVDRAGGGPVVEVYPAVALRSWGLRHKQYKKQKGQTELRSLVSELRGRAPWLAAEPDVWAKATAIDDVFDAIVCALVARAKACGQCWPIPSEDQAAAVSEGWIAIPKEGSLAYLASD